MQAGDMQNANNDAGQNKEPAPARKLGSMMFTGVAQGIGAMQSAVKKVDDPAIKEKTAAVGGAVATGVNTAGDVATGVAKVVGDQVEEKGGPLGKVASQVGQKAVEIVKDTFTPPEELLEFLRAPSMEGLQSHPELFVTMWNFIISIKSPKSALVGEMVKEAMDGLADAAVGQQMDEVLSGKLGLSPEISKQMIDFAKKNPGPAMKIIQSAMKMK